MFDRIPWRKLAVLSAACAVTYIFFINWCDFIFDCGCNSLWADAAEHCNINNATPPHCPWCVHDGRYGSIAFGAIFIAQSGLALWPGSLTRLRSILIFVAFPAIGGVTGILTGIFTGYWS